MKNRDVLWETIERLTLENERLRTEIERLTLENEQLEEEVKLCIAWESPTLRSRTRGILRVVLHEDTLLREENEPPDVPILTQQAPAREATPVYRHRAGGSHRRDDMVPRRPYLLPIAVISHGDFILYCKLHAKIWKPEG